MWSFQKRNAVSVYVCGGGSVGICIDGVKSSLSISKTLSVPGESSIIHNPEMHRLIIALITRETWTECTEARKLITRWEDSICSLRSC